jgi:hypothetical protein
VSEFARLEELSVERRRRRRRTVLITKATGGRDGKGSQGGNESVCSCI